MSTKPNNKKLNADKASVSIILFTIFFINNMLNGCMNAL